MATDPEVKIIVTTEGGETAATTLGTVKDATEGLGTGAKQAADGLDALATAETSAATQAKAIEDGIAHVVTEIEKVRTANTSFDEQKAKLEGIKAPLEANLAEMKKLGTEGKQSADGLTVAIGKIDAELAKLKTESQKTTDSLSKGFKSAEAAEKAFDQAVETGSPRVNGALSRLVITTKNLRDEIEKRRETGESVTTAEVAQLDRFERKLVEAQSKVRGLNDELAEQKDKLQEGGEKWNGMDDAMNKVLGKYGKIQAAATLTFAAFAEGYRIGQQLNTFFGTDMSEWESATASLGLRANIVVQSIADSVVAMGNAVAAVASGDLQEMKRAFKDWGEVGEKNARNLQHAIHDGDTELKAYAVSQGMVKKATDGASDAHDREAASIKKAADELAKKEALTRVHETVTKGMTNEMNSLINAIGVYLPQSELHSIAIKKEADELQKSLDTTDGLTKKQRDNIQAVIDQAKNVDTLSVAEKNALAGKIQTLDNLRSVTSATGDLNVKMDGSKVAISNAAAEQGKLTTSLEGGKIAISNTVTPLEQAGTGYIRMAEGAEKAKDPLATLTKDMQDHAQVAPVTAAAIDILTISHRNLAAAAQASAAAVRDANAAAREGASES